MCADDPGGERMRCLMCGRKYRSDGSLAEILLREDPLCEKCRGQWRRNHSIRRLDGIRVDSTWIYNDAYAEALLQFKELGDEALQDIFLYPVVKQLKRRYAGWTLVLMPSSAHKESVRGFSHLKEMFSCLGLPMIRPFIKLADTDQKKMNAVSRQEMEHLIVLNDNAVLPRKIVLADDVITTGSTLRGALHCLDRKKHRIRIYACASVPRPLP